MTFFAKSFRNQNGTAAIEFAFAVPILIVLFYGLAQFAIVLLANAGIRHALDVGARATTVYIGATPITDDQIRTVVTDSIYGVANGTLSTPTITRGTSNGVSFVDISINYSAPIDVMIYKFGPIDLSETRRAYLP